MKATATATAIAIATRVPVILWGPPGTGKSRLIESIAARMGVPCEVVIASLREPSDFAGLPVVEHGNVRFAPPAWAVRLAQAGWGILFLDEISTSAPAVQKALLRVVLDRVVGDLELPRGVAVVAAANPPECAADGWDLAPPLANRFVHLEWRGLEVDEWATALVSGEWPVPEVPVLPEEWEARPEATEARVLVAAFLRARPHLLHVMPTQEDQAGRAWPSRRSWHTAARLLGAVRVVGADEAVADLLVAGAVGEAAALEFLAWVRELDLPDPEELLADPARYRHPARGDQAYATLTAVVAAAVRNLTADRWAAAWAILGAAARAGGADVAAAAARELARHRGNLPMPPEVREFIPVLRAAGLM